MNPRDKDYSDKILGLSGVVLQTLGSMGAIALSITAIASKDSDLILPAVASAAVGYLGHRIDEIAFEFIEVKRQEYRKSRNTSKGENSLY